MSRSPRIDAHHHVWDLAVRDQPWTAGLPALRRSFPFDELRPCLVAHRIDATVLVQTIAAADETPELLALAAVEPMIAGVVGWVDLTAPDVAARLEALQASSGGDRLVAIRHPVQDETDPWWQGRADVRRGLAAVAAAGLAYDLLITAAQLDAAIDTVTALPQLRFVLDHAGKPRIRDGELEPWRLRIVELGRCANVSVKLSGLATEADPDAWAVADLVPYTEALLAAFGADRVMFGSDWPVCTLATSYDGVISAAEELTGQLSQAEQDAVFGGTAVRCYELATR
jgi:L-fucono-1,5-lactonase